MGVVCWRFLMRFIFWLFVGHGPRITTLALKGAVLENCNYVRLRRCSGAASSFAPCLLDWFHAG